MTVTAERAVAPDAWARAGGLDRLLGDPHDDTAPAGLRALLDAERHGEPCAGAEQVLDAFGLGAEFVPERLGPDRLADGVELDLVTGGPRERREVRTALVLARGVGGFNAAAVVRAPHAK